MSWNYNIKIIHHYPLISNPERGKSDRRTLCGEEVREVKWIDGRTQWHMFSIFPEDIDCSECKKLVKGSGLVRYSNSSENPF